MKRITLKPCPFCGGEAEILPCTGLLKAVRVVCKVCKCATPPVGILTEGEETVKLADEGAAEVWNNRRPVTK